MDKDFKFEIFKKNLFEKIDKIIDEKIKNKELINNFNCQFEKNKINTNKLNNKKKIIKK